MGFQQWTEADLEAQYQRAISSGWAPYFEAAAQQHNFQPELLMAIASRETNMKNIKGDVEGGVCQGYGIMQVDIKNNPSFCASWTEDDVQGSIKEGAAMLAEKRDALAHYGITDPRLIAAAYNCGQGTVHSCASAQPAQDPDQHTTWGNYGSDVMKRMAVFARLRAAQPQTATAKV